ncbi:alpha/beta fold hydrolase [Vitiosangium sp. GDMCC 1.1324]|uniref:alpha/beta fold hydrolase n=1 Tax=Vitiosangium sp. (strain GDMCC 1.1324) TaxID=2138576 RepID=UPI00130ECC4A|nr:alpha/beta hydrolase [Vitiosangium sp. GDMCC 1.1324]
MKTLERNGTRLAYDEVGRSPPPLVFIHGLGCDRSYFAPQLTHFGRTHRAIAVDLRSHGDSTSPDDGTLAALADDVAWLCQELSLQAPVLVGHSLGGVVALELSRRHPGQARAIVLLDSAVAMTSEIRAMSEQLLRALIATQDLQQWASLCEQHIGPAASPDLRARILSDFKRSPARLLQTRTEQSIQWDAMGALQAYRGPLLYVQGLAPFSKAILHAACPQAQVERLESAGHYSTLAAPAAVNALLERFLATL